MIRHIPLPFGLSVLLLVIVLGNFSARAELRIDITRGNIDPLPIAVTAFSGGTEEETSLASDVADVVSADLERSGLFRPIERSAFIEQLSSLAVRPRFGDWRIINAQALVHGRAQLMPDGRLRVEFRLWDVFAEQQISGWAFQTTQDNWRQISHKIADKIYERITGESGYFDSRIVYVSESSSAMNRIKRLAIMDQDGANHRFLTDGGTLVLTPRFSPTSQEITYLSYVNDQPRVYIYNIESGRQEILGDFPGMTFAPRFTPDGNKVIMSLATGGNSEIYSMDLRTRRVRRLTKNPAIDTSPSASPDGESIAFNSDRGGSQQIYVMDSDGGNVHRISFGEGRYATPVWSPRGDLVAFTKMLKGEFYIGVMKFDGSGERLLAKGFLVEGPTWAPNGRVLAFFRQEPQSGPDSGGARLFSIDLTGHNEREILTPLNASDPAWSPLLP